MADPARDLPLYVPPAHTYARKLKLIFALGAQDPADAAVSQKYLAPLITRLPSAITELLPANVGLSEVLGFLESYDSPPTALSSLLSGPISESSLKPSLLFRSLVNEIQRVMDVGTSPQTVNEVAWARTVPGLPSHVRDFLPFLGINRFPTDLQFLKLNEVWSRKDPVSVAALPEAITGRLDLLTDAINKLSTRDAAFAAPFFQRHDTRPLYHRRGGFAAGRRPFPHNNIHSQRNVVCFYHRKFGNAAHHCQPPCFFKSSAPTTQYNRYQKPSSFHNNSRIDGPSSRNYPNSGGAPTPAKRPPPPCQSQ